MYKSITLVTICAALLSLQQVYADGTCAAQANFDKCREIQNTLLSTCGPVDYACQCKAQQLILDCFALCTNYASEASIQSGTVKSICSVVPSSTYSSLPIASSTTSAPVAKSSSNSLPSASTSSPSPVKQNSTSSSATAIYPVFALLIACITVGLLPL